MKMKSFQKTHIEFLGTQSKHVDLMLEYLTEENKFAFIHYAIHSHHGLFSRERL